MYYGYGMGYDPMYLLLIVVSTILGMAKKVLVAAALTYVAAALVSVLQLLYYLSKTDRRGER